MSATIISMMTDREAITDLLHVGYLEACEAQNQGIVERTILAVSGEIADMLFYRYPQPWDSVPDLVRYIVAVNSAYRIVEAITSLVNSEGTSDNEWIPLQKQYKHCNDLLKQITDGKLKLPLVKVETGEALADERENASFAIMSGKAEFDMSKF